MAVDGTVIYVVTCTKTMVVLVTKLKAYLVTSSSMKNSSTV